MSNAHVRRLLLIIAALFGGAFLLAAPASAHASLVGSNPADGARLESAPASLTLSFDEPVGLSSLTYLTVTDEHGTAVQSGGPTHPDGDSTKVSVRLKPGLADGTYVGSYRVISADSHPVSGIVRFVVGTGPLVTTAVKGGASDGGAAAVFDVARWVSYGGFAVLGGAWLLLTVWPAGRDDRRAVRLVWAGWGAALVGAVAETLLEGVYAAGRPLTSMFDPTLINATLHSDFGQLHSGRVLLLGLMAIVLGRALQPVAQRSWVDDAFWPIGAGIAYTFAAVGHAVTTHPVWLSVLATTVHVVAMAAWVGGLVLLTSCVLPRREPNELGEVLPTFSRVAFTAVVALAVTGTYQAWRGIDSWWALFHTEYALLVWCKVIGFVGLIALGNLSRRIIQQRVGGGPLVAYAMTDDLATENLDDVSIERMRRSVLVEVVIAGIVLALTAVLVNQPRGPEALAAQDRKAVSSSAPLGDGRTVDVRINPGLHGPVEVQVELEGGTAKSITGTASQPVRRLGPIPLHLRGTGGGRYEATSVDLPAAGTWVIALVVTDSQFSAVTADVRIGLK